MKIGNLKYAPFHLPLKEPFHNSSNIIEYKRGFIIRMEDENSNCFYGEVSPLPGFSGETLSDTEYQLKELSKMKTDAGGFSLDEFTRYTKKFEILPSVNFGLEQALFSAQVFYNREPFKTECGNEINVNAVVGSGKPEEVISKMETYLGNGFSVFKIKIGKTGFSGDLALLTLIRKKFGNGIKIRLDVNGAWNFNEASSNMKDLKEFGIEFIEEPCHGIQNLKRLSAAQEIPVAVDESAENLKQLKSLIESGDIRFIVVKPSILGSVFEMIKLLDLSLRKNTDLIFSSAFESSVGKSMLVFLASLSKSNFAHGLNTAEFFNRNICSDPFPVFNGRIKFDLALFPPAFEIENLFKA